MAKGFKGTTAPLIKHYCKRCGSTFNQQKGRGSQFCKDCNDMIDANKRKDGYYKSTSSKTLFLANGIEIINNVMGKEIANRF